MDRGRLGIIMMAEAALAQFSLIKDIRAGKQCQTWATWLARHKSRYNITAAKHKRATPPPPTAPLHLSFLPPHTATISNASAKAVAGAGF